LIPSFLLSRGYTQIPLNLKKKLPNHESRIAAYTGLYVMVLWCVLFNCAYGIVTSERPFSSVQELPQSVNLAKFLWAFGASRV
jgi:hypothetical protein